MTRHHDDPEFAPGVDTPPDELDRRELIKLLAASAALAGACMQKPKERIMPRVEQPPEMTPGVPLDYATSMVIDGYATGLVVRTHEARPTKVEGNPDHPASLGATSALHQASVLGLYDPDRATGATSAGTPIELHTVARMFAARERIPGLWFLLHPQSSPAIEDQIARVRERHPGARFAFYSPLSRRNAHAGAKLAFGRPLEVQYRFDRADIVVALDADPLCTMVNSVRWSRDIATKRRTSSPAQEPSRIYVAEARPTPTGSLADHRLPVRPSEIGALASALVGALQGRRVATLEGSQRRWIERAARDLGAARGRAIVVVGDRQPPEVHALGHALNDAIGAYGRTAELTRSALIDPLGDGLPELVEALTAGAVKTLVIAEVNALYAAPGALRLGELIARVPEVVYAGFAHDETSRQCKWFIPLLHYMESWGDARAYDGTLSFVQPLIQPMHAGLSLLELLAVFAGELEPDGHAMIVGKYRRGTDDAARATWERDLQRGLLPNTAFPAEHATAAGAREVAAPVASAMEIAVDGSPSVYDGRFAANPWLQELPQPFTKITWGNAALVSPVTARELGVDTHDVVRVELGNESIELPIYVLPGHAEGCATVELGYGRNSVGADAYRVLPARSPASAPCLLVPTGTQRHLAITQEHFLRHDREVALDGTLAEYRADPEFTRDAWRDPPTMLPPVFPDVPKWGMTIDTTICSGCSACVIACQAENNIPVVGADAIRRNREMHWLRIDTYRVERDDGVSVINQPMLCQHCEDAPCEYVCPTYATQHSPDGLNEMTYNRCIGTRFCSNNCPYKVRRFNWFNLTNDTPATRRLQFNPNVTVRARGVMEKCSYCVQRIRGAEIASRRELRDIRPDEVKTACQQACPTGAIQFGRLDHAETTNVQWRREPRHYAVLNELGTRPKTIYLAKIWNPEGR
jgi:Fe-S-cluster-containing dehydrogenase component/anaerobic selenocysteine-containing dehydrogenase